MLSRLTSVVKNIESMSETKVSEAPEPPRCARNRPVATLKSLNAQVQDMIDCVGEYTRWSQKEFRIVRVDEALGRAKLLTEVENLRRDMKDV